MKDAQFSNAAQRKSYVGVVHDAGVQVVQERALDAIPSDFAELHRTGAIHIHDLDAYGLTYNCLQVDVLQGAPWVELSRGSDFRKINAIFAHYRELIVKLGNEQSGGIGFPNFDQEMEVLFDRLGLTATDQNLAMLADSIAAFVDWANTARDRCGQTTYYVSLNLGLATGLVGRSATRALLTYFRGATFETTKPNIIFKVKKGINCLPDDPNRDLFDLATACASRKMIPTFLLFDSTANTSLDPTKIGIMGCRTRVVADVFGEDRSVGRGNIAYVTMNLPRIALEVHATNAVASVEQKLTAFKKSWLQRAGVVRDILLHRYVGLLTLAPSDFPFNQGQQLWVEDFKGGVEQVFRHGTLSIGFIGLSEALEVLSGEKFHVSDLGCERALDFVRFMRDETDAIRAATGLNFTLLASSGEYISGRFPQLDRKRYQHPILEKGFYTNSFHIEVDSGVGLFRKLEVEGPFHVLANGGCITYVEFPSAPLENCEAVAEMVEAATQQGVSYLGINFPLDRCRTCGSSGTFDSCPACGGGDILRIRRVSGYLEDLAYFTLGKKAEAARRRPNLRAALTEVNDASRN